MNYCFKETHRINHVRKARLEYHMKNTKFPEYFVKFGLQQCNWNSFRWKPNKSSIQWVPIRSIGWQGRTRQHKRHIRNNRLKKMKFLFPSSCRFTDSKLIYTQRFSGAEIEATIFNASTTSLAWQFLLRKHQCLYYTVFICGILFSIFSQPTIIWNEQSNV